MKIALTYNLKPNGTYQHANWMADRYVEWDDAATIEAVQNALAFEHDVVLIEDGLEIESRLRQAGPDMVFNMAEGEGGADREAFIPLILQRCGIPFTGSSAQTLRLCLDKAATQRILCRHGLPTLCGTIVVDPRMGLGIFSAPQIVKPLHEGSSKGICVDSVVFDQDALRKQITWVIETYQQPALVEPFLSGREFTVALLGNGETVQILPIVEICFDNLPSHSPALYAYEAKWIWDHPQHPLDLLHCPANIEPGLAQELRDLCRKAFNILGCRDWCRIDVRLDAEDQPYFLEVNPLPGVLPDPNSHSCFPKAAAEAGITFPDLIRRVLRHACERYQLR
ncbi:MAG: ATP-grasp domain-containing protein [bacterium]|nr:ATP-grasp domain-containing protein [bacterium]